MSDKWDLCNAPNPHTYPEAEEWGACSKHYSHEHLVDEEESVHEDDFGHQWF